MIIIINKYFIGCILTVNVPRRIQFENHVVLFSFFVWLFLACFRKCTGTVHIIEFKIMINQINVIGSVVVDRFWLALCLYRT